VLVNSRELVAPPSLHFDFLSRLHTALLKLAEPFPSAANVPFFVTFTYKLDSFSAAERAGIQHDYQLTVRLATSPEIVDRYSTRRQAPNYRPRPVEMQNIKNLHG